MNQYLMSYGCAVCTNDSENDCMFWETVENYKYNNWDQCPDCGTITDASMVELIEDGVLKGEVPD